MSLISALDDSEQSGSKGWSGSSRFSMDGQGSQGQGQQQWHGQGMAQHMYQQLISQNNSGAVPEALNEEEIIEEAPQGVHTMHYQSGQQNIAPAEQQASHSSPVTQAYSPGMYQAARPQQQLQQHAKQQTLSPGTAVKTSHGVSQHSSSQHQQQYSQQQMVAGNQHIQQHQQVYHQQPNYLPQSSPRNIPIAGHNQQVQFQSPDVEKSVNIDMKLMRNQQQIIENQHRIEMMKQTGVPQHQNFASPKQQQQQRQDVSGQQQPNAAFKPAPRSLVGVGGAQCDYVGSMTLSNLTPQPKQSENLQRLLALSQNCPQNRVDVMINNGTTGISRVGPSSMSNVAPTSQVITLSTHRPLVGQNAVGAQNSNFPGTYISEGNIASPNQNPVQVQTVSSNVHNSQSGNTPLQRQTVINSKNVVLEGGGKFEEGFAYLIRNKKGIEMKMVWRNGEFVSCDDLDPQLQSQPPTVVHAEPKQRGRGRGRGQWSYRGRGRGQLQGNATGMLMSPNVRGQSPMNVQRQQVSVAVGPQPLMRHQSIGTPETRAPLILAQGMQGHRIIGQPHAGMLGQPMGRTVILNTLMPAAQVSQKTAGTSTTNLARRAVEAEEATDQAVSGEVEPRVPSEADTAGGDIGVDTAPNIPDDPDAVAICQFCGYSSNDKLKCESCGRKFNHLTKYFSKNNPDTAKRRKIDISTSEGREGGIDKKTFYGQKFAEQQQVYASVLNSSTITVYNPNIRKVVQGIGGGRKIRVTRGRMTKAPMPIVNETVTISSDEEETPDSVPKARTPSNPGATEGSVTGTNGSSAECPESPLIPVIPITNRLVSAGRREKMEDEKGVAKRGKREKSLSPIQITLPAKVVRVGSLRGISIEPMLMSKDGLHFFIEGENGSHRFHVYPQEIQQCLAKFDSSTSYIFLLTSVGCGVRTRQDLGMATHTDPKLPPPEPYFHPRSRDMRHHMITIILDTIENSTKLDFLKLIDQFKMWGHQMDESFYMDLNADEADEILKQSSRPTAVLSQGAGTPVVSDHQYSVQTEEERNRSRSPSPPKIGFAGAIIKLLTYPPPPAKGAISITNEDLYCLHEGEFLNDVIIDFYLKYLFLDKLSEADRNSTYIFSSFFYKRLTQRIRSAGVDDDPSVTPAVKRHSRVKTWTRNVDLFKKDFIVIPINEHAHWFLAIICYPGLDVPYSNPFLPKPMSVPLLEPTNVPTPPQPADNDENEDDEGNEESESPIPDNGQAASTMETGDEPSSVDPENKMESQESKEPQENEAADTATENGSQTSPHTEVPEQSQTSEGDDNKAGDNAGDTMEAGTSMETSGETNDDKVTGGSQTKLDVLSKACRVIIGEAIDDASDRSPDEYSIGLKQPCIIIFDSLSGPPRSRIVTVLKEYLQVEYAAKKGGAYNRLAVKGCVPKVPQQNNYSDCGVFVLQYVESFFEDPIQDFSVPMKGLHNWFTDQRISGKREELRDLIIDLKDSYEKLEKAKT